MNSPKGFLLALAAVISMTALQSCSLQNYDFTECENNEACRGAFGWGSVCGDDGFCTDNIADNRCRITSPLEFWLNPEDYRNHIVIGTISSFINDESLRLSVNLAIDQINRPNTQGLASRKYAVVHCNYDSSGGLDSDDVASDIADYLANTLGVPLIIGGMNNTTTLAAFQAIDGSDTVMISPAASAGSLTSIDEASPTDSSPGFLWRTVPPANIQAQALASVIEADEETTAIAIVHESSPDGQEMEGLLTAALDSSIDARNFPFSPGDANVRNDAIGTAVNTSGFIPDGVVFIASEPAVFSDMVNVAGARDDYNDVNVFLTDLGHDVFVVREGVRSETGRRLFDQIVGVAPAPADNDQYDEFEASYRTTFPQQDPALSPFIPYTYDAAWMGIFGSAWSFYHQSQKVTGEGIAEGLRRMSDPSGIEIPVGPGEWTQLKSLFQSSESVNIVGASSDLDYDLTREELRGGRVQIWRIIEDSGNACDGSEVIEGHCFITDDILTFD